MHTHTHTHTCTHAHTYTERTYTHVCKNARAHIFATLRKFHKSWAGFSAERNASEGMTDSSSRDAQQVCLLCVFIVCACVCVYEEGCRPVWANVSIKGSKHGNTECVFSNNT